METILSVLVVETFGMRGFLWDIDIVAHIAVGHVRRGWYIGAGVRCIALIRGQVSVSIGRAEGRNEERGGVDGTRRF